MMLVSLIFLSFINFCNLMSSAEATDYSNNHKERKWMPTSAEICGRNNVCHTADISGFRLLFRDMMNEDEFNHIKTNSDDGYTYTYFSVLQNSAKQPIQLLPITIMYKTQI